MATGFRYWAWLAVTCAVPAAMAQESTTAGEAVGRWTGDVALGYERQSGNTDSSTVNLDANAEKEVRPWHHQVHFDFDFESSDEVTTEEDFFLWGQSNYYFHESEYVLGYASWQEDRFAGIDYEWVVSTGYGRRLVSRPRHRLDADIGPGIRETNPTDGPVRRDAILRIGERYVWTLSDSARLKQSLSVETGGGNTVSLFTLGLTTDITDTLKARLAYEAEHTHKVPDDKHRTDTKVIVSLVYTF